VAWGRAEGSAARDPDKLGFGISIKNLRQDDRIVQDLQDGSC
jgi:hypothetical protein